MLKFQNHWTLLYTKRRQLLRNEKNGAGTMIFLKMVPVGHTKPPYLYCTYSTLTKYTPGMNQEKNNTTL
jgi:hypothetical protein